MLGIIIGLTLGTMLAIYTWQYLSLVNVKKGQYFGCLLTPEQAEHEEVVKIVEVYKKKVKLILAFLGVSLGLFFFETVYFSITGTLLFIWILVITLVPLYWQIKSGEAIKRIKKEKGWYPKRMATTLVDTNVAKAEFKVLPGIELHLIAVLIGLAPVVLKIGITFLAWFMGLTSMVVVCVLYYSQRVIKRQNNIVYTQDSQVNLVINQGRKRDLMWLFAIFSPLQALLNFYIVWLSHSENYQWQSLITVMVLSTLIPVLMILTVQKRHKDRMALNLSENKDYLYDQVLLDEEQYWYGGVFYNNPRNHKVLVSKRNGMGSTFNLGHPKGKAYFIASAVLIFVLVVPLWGHIIYEDIVEPRYGLDDNGVYILTSTYKDRIAIESIESIELIDDVKLTFKTNGSATGLYARGYFTASEHGPVKVYLFRGSKPILKIVIEERTILFSGREAKEAPVFYRQIKGAMEKSGLK